MDLQNDGRYDPEEFEELKSQIAMELTTKQKRELVDYKIEMDKAIESITKLRPKLYYNNDIAKQFFIDYDIINNAQNAMDFMLADRIRNIIIMICKKFKKPQQFNCHWKDKNEFNELNVDSIFSIDIDFYDKSNCKIDGGYDLTVLLNDINDGNIFNLSYGFPVRWLCGSFEKELDDGIANYKMHKALYNKKASFIDPIQKVEAKLTKKELALLKKAYKK